LPAAGTSSRRTAGDRSGARGANGVVVHSRVKPDGTLEVSEKVGRPPGAFESREWLRLAGR
jgi:hypothetical protein